MTLGALVTAVEDADAAERLRELDAAGRLTAMIPELEASRGFEQPEMHHYTLLEHELATVAALDELLGKGGAAAELRTAIPWVDFDASLGRAVDGVTLGALLKLGGLLHDVAKPATATMQRGRLRFPRHAPLGAEMMEARLPAVGFGPAATDFVARMVRYHMRPGELLRNQPPTDRPIRRFVQDLDGHVLPLMLLNVADGWATRGPGYTRENFRRHLKVVEYVLARAVAVMEDEEPPLLDGHDLMEELDLESGRLLGAVLTSVRRAQATGAISNRAEALALARERLASLQQHRDNG